MMQQNQQHASEGDGRFRPSTTSRIKRSVDTFYTTHSPEDFSLVQGGYACNQ
jgi:hypothetical protein